MPLLPICKACSIVGSLTDIVEEITIAIALIPKHKLNIIGDNEIETNKVKVKEMATGEETECELDAKEILNVIRRK